MADILLSFYPWARALHVISVISWMAGLLYLPRLFVYHSERGSAGSEVSEILKVMEGKLLNFIMNPAMIASWIFGLWIVFTPGVIDWSLIWPWAKALMVLGMTWFHLWLVKGCKNFNTDRNILTGRRYRIMNEVPTLLMIGIVIMVIVRPF
jgi:protoporphyrinogen IX oxidase